MIHWINNEVWLSVSLLEEDRTLFAEYVKDNPFFRNRLSVYLTVFASHHSNLTKYKEEGTILAEEINTFLEAKP